MALLYYVMPYVEGQSLRERLRQESRLPLDEALRIAREAAQALQYAHEHGVVHRDVKPENLLLTRDGNTLVADFGIARALSGGDERLTETGLAIGTPQYMSPEQATAGEVDARSDQYSLACVVYEMLCGEPPFTGATPQAVIAKSLNAPRPSLRLVRESVPVGLDSAVTRALARDPVDRFPSASAFAEALGPAAAFAASPVASSAAGYTPRVPRRAVILVGASILLVAGLAATLLLRSRHEGPVAPEAEVIAVLPFRASGVGLEVMGEGMVDLLARDLDAVGGVRTVDPRTVLSRWRRVGGGGADLPQALKVGREVGAGSVLTGSVVEAGGRVRLDAELRSVAGQPLARTRGRAGGQSPGSGGRPWPRPAPGRVALAPAAPQSPARLPHHQFDRSPPRLSRGRAVLPALEVGLGESGLYPGGPGRYRLCARPYAAGHGAWVARGMGVARVWAGGASSR
jgi:serine/threonine-protein kinase